MILACLSNVIQITFRKISLVWLELLMKIDKPYQFLVCNHMSVTRI